MFNPKMALFEQPDTLILHISKFATVSIRNESDNYKVTLKKSSYKTVGNKVALVKTEVDLSATEIELLGETIPLIKNFLAVSYTASQVPYIPPRQ